ncbi:MAG: SDR family oxidoreductase [Nitriliruptorales bacterium]|nr:SDR family oxidoreductase [Nitriliruptorales bacterium]
MAAQTVVITGASGGVGRALARKYGERGCNVGLLARGEAGLQGAKEEVEARGGRAIAVPTDVADDDQVEQAAEKVEAEFGPIDIWINNAMVTVLAKVWNVDPEEFKRVTEVNYLGVVHGCLAALKRMRPRNAGTIVNVGSALAFRGIPLQAAYCGSKHAIQGFTESLYAELLHEDSDIDLCSVHLPGLNTTQFTWGRNKLDKLPQPVPPIFQPEVAADGIMWAADNGRRETYVAASTPLTIWGNRLARGAVARYLASGNISAQQSDKSADLYPGDNLFEPQDQDEDRGSHGPYDDQAHGMSPFDKVSQNRGKVAAGVALAGVVAAVASKFLGRD